MICEKERITHWLNQQLSETEQQQFEAHLAGCKECREELAIAQLVINKIGQIDIPGPAADMEVSFQATLNNYKHAINKKDYSWKDSWSLLYEKLTLRPKYQLAYSFLLLLIGLAAGYIIQNRPKDSGRQEIAALSSEVQEMKQMMMLALLQNTSASERIKAVSYTEEIGTADDQVVNALFATLNEDPNVNVRLVTLEALTKYSSDPLVRQRLVQSILLQESPLMQAALADVMIRLQEKRSIESFKALLKNIEDNNPAKAKIQQTIIKLNA